MRPRVLRYLLAPVPVVTGLFLVLLILYVIRLELVGDYLIRAIRYPFGIEYGEGIDWQRAILMFGDRMYGDIHRYPYIVFNYPPFYHTVVRAIGSFGADYLAAGRAVSVAAAGALALLVGLTAVRASPVRPDRLVRVVSAAVAGLSVLTYEPVIAFAGIMRVDMLGACVSALGTYLALTSITRPLWIYPATIAFVAAIFTKQTLIAAPVGAFLVLLLRNPRHALIAIACGLALGLSVLAVLEWQTDGGFLRHIVLYNINRFDIRRVYWGIVKQEAYRIYVLIVFGTLAYVWVKCRHHVRLSSWRDLTDCIARHDDVAMFGMLTVQLVVASAMLVTLGKPGSAPNYFIESMGLWSVFTGIACSLVLRPIRHGERALRWEWSLVPAAVLPAALLCQFALTPLPAMSVLDDAQRNQELAELVQSIHDARKPVLSEDMVLLMRAGKEVPIEPFIFAELTALGAWDQRPFLEMINTNAFEFVLTTEYYNTYHDDPGSDNRFSRAVLEAIRTHYPVVTREAGYVLHRAQQAP
jgi:hypothetical protein